MTNVRVPTLVYRDDGPLAGVVGYTGLVGLVPAPRTVSAALTGALSGAVVALGTMAVAFATLAPGAGARGFLVSWLPVVGAGWCLAVAGLAAGHRHAGTLDWLVPPVLRTVEYVFVGALGLTSGAPGWLVFVLLGAAVYHHYETAQRVRQGMGAPPRWLQWAGLGWDGRMLGSALAAAAGALVPVYAGLAVALWLLFVGESAALWLRPTAYRRGEARPRAGGE